MAEYKGKFRERAAEVHKTIEYKIAKASNEIASEISTILDELGLSRSDLAKRLGVTKSSVSQLLSGDSNPRLSTLVTLAEALGSEVCVSFLETRQPTSYISPESDDTNQLRHDSYVSERHAKIYDFINPNDMDCDTNVRLTQYPGNEEETISDSAPVLQDNRYFAGKDKEECVI